jgi:hypothetical protein
VQFPSNRDGVARESETEERCGECERAVEISTVVVQAKCGSSQFLADVEEATEHSFADPPIDFFAAEWSMRRLASGNFEADRMRLHAGVKTSAKLFHSDTMVSHELFPQIMFLMI